MSMVYWTLCQLVPLQPHLSPTPTWPCTLELDRVVLPTPLSTGPSNPTQVPPLPSEPSQVPSVPSSPVLTGHTLLDRLPSSRGQGPGLADLGAPVLRHSVRLRVHAR